ncbi:MAG: hypothetical protein NC301_08555 [Bacteroides sp.]|nr:hypothetical protein [Bacteroides sp.]MCM1380216.1 hypothetical protein [Bacteroides sp.]MCM1446525.1 hypothetical protein [Prevotella sp.]
MSLFLTLIIILLVWFFIIAPFVRLIRVSRQWQNTFNNATRQQQRQQHHKRPAQPQPKKKIDPTVGEYVEFTETEVSQTATDGQGNTTATRETESQITDVTWEDIPE